MTIQHEKASGRPFTFLTDVPIAKIEDHVFALFDADLDAVRSCGAMAASSARRRQQTAEERIEIYRTMIEAETAARQAKTARLRAARLQRDGGAATGGSGHPGDVSPADEATPLKPA